MKQSSEMHSQELISNNSLSTNITSVSSISTKKQSIQIPAKQFEDHTTELDMDMDMDMEMEEEHKTAQQPYLVNKSKKVRNPVDIQGNFNFKIEALKSQLQKTKQTLKLSGLISLKTKEGLEQQINLQNRTPVNLYCVIDRSGSMSGQKLQEVKNALKVLLDLLGDSDTLCLIEFTTYSTVLVKPSPITTQSKIDIYQIIDNITPGGGTTIFKGLQQAMDLIENQQKDEKLTSIFLLSDGQDSLNVQQVKDYNKKNQDFTIQSFGFGSDHDPQLMTDICQVKSGEFYYVQEISTVDELFVQALGDLFSIVAKNLTIQVQVRQQGCFIQQVYGDMWSVKDIQVDKQFRQNNQIQQASLVVGVDKQYLFDIEVPVELQEGEIVLAEANLTMFNTEDINLENPIQEKAEMAVKFGNQEIVNEEVYFHTLRIQAADAQKQCIKLVEQGQYDKGKEIVKKAQEQILGASEEFRQKLNPIFQQLEMSLQNCVQRQQYSKIQRCYAATTVQGMFSSNSMGNDHRVSSHMSDCLVQRTKTIKSNQ